MCQSIESSRAAAEVQKIANDSLQNLETKKLISVDLKKKTALTVVQLVICIIFLERRVRLLPYEFRTHLSMVFAYDNTGNLYLML